MIHFALALVGLIGILGAERSEAQGIPPYVPMNPLLTSRSGLYFQPYVDPARRWEVRILTDYASSVEYTILPGRSLILDAELLRVDATVLRNVGAGFFGVSAGINGSYGGFLDPFLDWYHDLTGLRVVAREQRPRNQFDYAIKVPSGDSLIRTKRSSFLGDVRLIGGHRHTRHWQTALAVTLPAAPQGYGRDVVSVSALTTARSAIGSRLETEVGLGLSYSPESGDLRDYQRTFFVGANAGLRLRFWGKQAAFVNLYYQSPNYRDSGMRALDQRELTLDYGFLLKAKKGPEWFLGMTEDLEPRGPAIDLSFRIGARW